MGEFRAHGFKYNLPMALRTPLPLYLKILIGLAVGLVLGLLANLLLPGDETVQWIVRNIAQPLGQIFLRLIFMVVLPLILSALVLGVVELGGVGRIGRIGLKTLAFTAVISGVSVIIGLMLVNLFQPGAAIPEASRQALLGGLSSHQAVTGILDSARETKTLAETLVDIVPRNPFAEFANAFDPSYRGGGILSVMFFAVVFGIALSMVAGERARPLVRGFQGLYDVTMKIIGFAMRLAPYGVAGLMFATASQLGLPVIAALFGYVSVVVVALILQQLVTYGLIVRFAAKRNPLEFFKRIREVMVTAFSTSSSNATLPTSLRVTRDELKVRPEIANFVLTVGATANQNGTALYEGVTVLFLAQFYGIDLSIGEQLVVVLLSMLAGIGTAGVPGGSLPLVVLVLITVGIPADGIGIILGVDRVLDMCRTVVNVCGDITLATWLDASEPVPAARG
jgi:DAACS family dicarboxylate/amino acid:cation (Na+ or H+) symporter